MTGVRTPGYGYYMNTSEPRQSVQSRDALNEWERLMWKTGEARGVEIHLEVEIKRLQAELRAARKITKAAQAVEDAASRHYEATPYTDAA